MTQRTRGKLLNAATVLICILVVFTYSTSLENSEFPSGRLTGVLLELYDAGLCLFVIGLLVTFPWPRPAAAAGLVASLLCLPVFLYEAFPGASRRLFPGKYSVPLLPGFMPDRWTAVGITVISLALFVNIRTLLPRRTLKSGPA